MNTYIHEFMPSSEVIRKRLALHQSFIEASLGVALADAVILQVDVDLTQMGVETILACSNPPNATNLAIRNLHARLASAEVPPGFPPLLEVNQRSREGDDSGSILDARHRKQSFALQWRDCPVALRFHQMRSSVIAWNVYYHSGPDASETEQHILITRRECAAEVVRLVEELDRRDREPKLHVLPGRARPVRKCDWDQLVLDEGALSLLKNDFESFFQREAWFKEKQLPFRRGYLLHGPPGNGKTTAIRAMMCSRGLSAYTMRLFERDQEDRELEALFDRALNNRPALVVLEDLDRAFPKTGETRSSISVQQLLNCLDGVATGEGVIVVATANEPTILDPAILRRPGRFDRVVHFPNPTVELRQKYFRLMNPGFSSASLRELAAQSGGFSFAQLRETYIMAGQLAYEAQGEITPEYMLAGIRSLRTTMLIGAKRSNAAGFQDVAASEVAV